MNRRYFYFAILVLILGGLFFVFYLDSDLIDKRFEVESAELITISDDQQAIRGTIKSNAESEVPGLKVVVKLTGEDGEIISQGFTHTDQIQPGQVTEFEFKLVDFEMVASFEIQSITIRTGFLQAI